MRQGWGQNPSDEIFNNFWICVYLWELWLFYKSTGTTRPWVDQNFWCESFQNHFWKMAIFQQKMETFLTWQNQLFFGQFWKIQKFLFSLCLAEPTKYLRYNDNLQLVWELNACGRICGGRIPLTFHSTSPHTGFLLHLRKHWGFYIDVTWYEPFWRD